MNTPIIPKNHEEEVKLAMALKLARRTKRKVREMTCEDPCHCRDHLNATIAAILKLGSDVFEYRPEFYTSIVILGDAVREMVADIDNARSKEVIYL